ncbi:DUF262 domain-containing protein [Sutcliffiella cohnii]|uniref:DUF262 domain-containing protein n=1 Tax=Sutcliffiella cohnii TaxID=33932 RepID=UPI002E203510|nr:DUF262 domain-containing protein [Sutcliffiella cohnii]
MFNYNDVLKATKKKKNKIEETPIDVIVEKYKKGEFRIVTEQARYPLANLRNIFNEAYNLNPEYQRRRVWDKKRKSRLIESFIINVPVPPIFLYEYDYSQYEIMDGLQRVSTIIDFFDNKFKLSDLEVWTELEDMGYNDLPREIKLAIDRRYLSAIILLKETAKDEKEAKKMKKFVFQRLNTGGIELSPQEIRNAIYMSEFNDNLIKWAESDEFRLLWGEVDNDNFKRMEDCELVLRFFTYKSACKNNLSMSSIKMLDTYSLIAKDFSTEEISVLENLFYGTLNIVKHLFLDRPFISEPENKKSEKMIYDAVMIACAELYEERLEDKVFKLNSGLLKDEKYNIIEENKSIFNGKYTSIKNVKERVAIIKRLIRDNLK